MSQADPEPYCPPQHQLVFEIYAASFNTSIRFYTALGFETDWKVPGVLAQLSWDGSILLLRAKDKVPGLAEDTNHGAGNIRIMLPDVDAKYEQCKKLGHYIEQEIGDRQRVLRDFTVRDPDGIGVRFGTFLPGRGRKEQSEGPDAEGVVRKKKAVVG